MLEQHLLNKLIERLGLEPTAGQQAVFKQLSSFIVNFTDDRIFLLSGFAGTGKTSVIAALVGVLAEMKHKVMLLAPTGRAAKVLSSYAHAPAFTIHKKLYRQRSIGGDAGQFSLDRNLHTDTLFIVDEASMVSNSSQGLAMFGSGRLLDDLISYVRSGTRCRLILVGDRAQLPPVGVSTSPALDPNWLAGYGDCLRVELTDVVRQAAQSGILTNATLLRGSIDEEPAQLPTFKLSLFTDVVQVSGTEVQELIDEAYSRYGTENVTIICRSNLRANRYNAGIRATVFGREEELVQGDRLMVVKNCYRKFDPNDRFDFIANGDVAEVQRIRKYEERYGFRFANVLLKLPDYEGAEVECKVLLDTLMLDAPALSQERSTQFFHDVAADYAHIPDKRNRYKAMKEDPFFSALQVKYAYALTCHKAQGGQWKAVFLDQLFFKEPLQTEDLRWLYTAFTRATEKLYLVNFKEKSE